MKPSDFQKTVQCRLESCLKKVVRSVVKDYYKELNRRKNKEISFSEYQCHILKRLYNLFRSRPKQPFYQQGHLAIR